MRSRSASALKPPKMTVCGAPMRAQASRPIGQLRDHRHVEGDAVALLDAQIQQHGGEAG